LLMDLLLPSKPRINVPFRWEIMRQLGVYLRQREVGGQHPMTVSFWA